MWVRMRIDIAWRDLLYGVAQCFLARDRGAIRRALEQGWSAAHGMMACLSVRTGFDLLLWALDLPPGSEVLLSAANIADMTRIVHEHKLVPVPVELDPERMAPTAQQVRRAVTPASRVLVVAHLFGSRVDLPPLLEVARQHGLFVIEDCAQAFDGEYGGHADCDAVMFSFGPVKTATALGGALMRLKDPKVLATMRRLEAGYPVQDRWRFLVRLGKYAAMKAGSTRPIFSPAVAICRALGRDYDRLISHAARGFPGPDFFPRIRRQASTPLLALLRRRLGTFDAARLARRVGKGNRLAELVDSKIPCPAAKVRPHTHWTFPIVVENPRQVMAALTRAGFDSTQGHNLIAGTAPPDRPELEPVTARQTLERMIYLPCYPDLTDKAIERLAEVLRAECR